MTKIGLEGHLVFGLRRIVKADGRNAPKDVVRAGARLENALKRALRHSIGARKRDRQTAYDNWLR